jgi:hypothetical protein
MAVNGPLGSQWHNINIHRNSKLVVEIESHQDRQPVGKITITATEIARIPADEKGNIMV